MGRRTQRLRQREGRGRTASVRAPGAPAPALQQPTLRAAEEQSEVETVRPCRARARTQPKAQALPLWLAKETDTKSVRNGHPHSIPHPTG